MDKQPKQHQGRGYIHMMAALVVQPLVFVSKAQDSKDLPKHEKYDANTQICNRYIKLNNINIITLGQVSDNPSVTIISASTTTYIN